MSLVNWQNNDKDKKVFIRGCKGRGSEAIDILTGLGANAPKYELADSDDYLYFINHDNEIGVALINSEVGYIIMDNYKEIELQQQQQWKEGDILVYNTDPFRYAVFGKYNNDDTFEAYFILEDKTAHFDATAHVGNYHLTNAAEKRMIPMLFFFLLNNLDAVRKCLPK